MSEAIQIVDERAEDGLQNLLTGQGGKGDSRAGGYRSFVRQDRDYKTLLDTYLSSWMAARIVEVPAEEMTRAGRRFDIEDSGDQDKLKAESERLALWEKIRECIQWADLFGGGAILFGLDGTGELSEPLDHSRIKPDSLKFVHALDSQSLIPHAGENTSKVMDPTSDQFMQPEFYTIASANISRVHHTRLVKFPGIQLPWLEMQRNLWWGASRLDRAFDAIADAETVIGGVAELVTEAKIDVYGIPDLMNMLSTPDGEAKVRRRIELADQIKSIWRAIIKDAGEDYEQKQNAIVQGMAALIEQYLVILSAATGIPVTKLLGTSAAGLNATGEGDLRNYYDMISARQENYLRPRLNQIDRIFLPSAIGKQPDDCPWVFGKLRQMSDEEEAELQSKRATRDQIYLQEGVITPDVVAKQLKEDGTYVAIDDAYIEELEAELKEEAAKPDPPPVPAGPPMQFDPAGNPLPPAPESEPDPEPEPDDE